jgi:hypothetical protein
MTPARPAYVWVWLGDCIILRRSRSVSHAGSMARSPFVYKESGSLECLVACQAKFCSLSC